MSRIAVAHVDHMYVRTLSRALDKLGVEVQYFGTAPHAAATLDVEPFPLVVMGHDQRMCYPSEDALYDPELMAALAEFGQQAFARGNHLARRIRESDANGTTPLLLLSPKDADSDYVEHALAAGVSKFYNSNRLRLHHTRDLFFSEVERIVREGLTHEDVKAWALK